MLGGKAEDGVGGLIVSEGAERGDGRFDLHFSAELNGGDAGFGLQIEWNAPEGVTVTPLRFDVTDTLYGFPTSTPWRRTPTRYVERTAVRIGPRPLMLGDESPPDRSTSRVGPSS